jgi:hypothetical protein
MPSRSADKPSRQTKQTGPAYISIPKSVPEPTQTAASRALEDPKLRDYMSSLSPEEKLVFERMVAEELSKLELSHPSRDPTALPQHNSAQQPEYPNRPTEYVPSGHHPYSQSPQKAGNPSSSSTTGPGRSVPSSAPSTGVGNRTPVRQVLRSSLTALVYSCLICKHRSLFPMLYRHCLTGKPPSQVRMRCLNVSIMRS